VDARELELETARLDLAEAKERLEDIRKFDKDHPQYRWARWGTEDQPGWRMLEFKIARLLLKVKALEGGA